MSEYLITFNKPYQFEDQQYTEIDLSKLEDLTTGDLIAADGAFGESGQFAMMNEMTTGYSCILASKATGKPVEFFQQLPAKEGVKIRLLVMGFFNG